MSNDGEIANRLPGWLFSAARGATAMGFRDIADDAGVAVGFLQRLERLVRVELRDGPGRGATGVDPAPLGRVLATYRKHGLELRGDAGGHPAMLVCVDAKALHKVRSKHDKGNEVVGE